MQVSIFNRLILLAIGWGAVGCGYWGMSFIQSAGVVLPETYFDSLIPYNPAGIWLYCSFFLLVPMAFLWVEPKRLPWLVMAFFGCILVSAFVFLCYPTTLIYPPNFGLTISEKSLLFLQNFDSRQNCLPSLHGALTVLCVWALISRQRLFVSSLLILWGLAIGYATIQTRQHIMLDLSAGILLGLISGFGSSKLNNHEYVLSILASITKPEVRN